MTSRSASATAAGASLKLWPHMLGVLRPMPMLGALPDAAITGSLLFRQLNQR